MRKGIWSAAAAVVLLSGPGGLLRAPWAQAADTQVVIDEDNLGDSSTWKFTPREVSVPVGSTVTWLNNGDLEHTATADAGAFDSKNLAKGQSFKFTFSTPGEFTYNCTPHPFMTGVIKVTGVASTPTTAATTTTTAPAAGGTTTTAKGADGSTTTTTAAAAGATTTTTAGGATTTTLAPATTPSSAPDTAGVTTTTAKADDHGEEAAAGEHGGGSGGEDTNALGVAFAGVLTLILGAISVKLLAAKV